MPGNQQIRLDPTDREIIEALVEDGRLTFHQLALRVHLSPSAVTERVRRLRTNGVLAGFSATIDLDALGYRLRALSDVKIRESMSRAEFETELAGIPGVVSAAHTTGEFDYQLHLVTTGTEDLQRIVDRLRSSGVREIQSRIILGELVLGPTMLLH